MKANPIVRAVMIDVGRVHSRAAVVDRAVIAVDRDRVPAEARARAVDLVRPVAISVDRVDLKTVADLEVADSSVDRVRKVDARKIAATIIAIKDRVRRRSLGSKW